MPTISSTLIAIARRVPGAEALTFTGRRYTHAELDAAVDRAATVRSGLGLAMGDRLALMAANSDRFAIADVARA
jgi:fatty-acyl-CoA synthase